MRTVILLTTLVIVHQAEFGLAQPDSPPTVVFEEQSQSAPVNRIDEPILAKLQSLGIRPAATCSDSVFVRRVYLDAIGTLPTAAEVRSFLTAANPDKRRLLIDHLLQRPEFADYWAMKWCDVLRVKSEVPINLWPNAVQAYHRWVRDSVKQNKPYDQFVREMLTASGSNFREPPVNFYRAVRDRHPETIAQTVALTFMGARTEGWPEERLAGMAAFFQDVKYKQTNEWKEEIVLVDQLGGTARHAVLPDGTRVTLAPGADGRAAFADWLIKPENPWFARNIVNRVWCWLLGVGIVHEPDDIRPDNPPTNPELLAVLERELIASRWDLRHIYRLILNSATYQRSCIPTTERPEAEKLFAHYPMRRLDAEVLIDAICRVTGTTETYTSLIPEPWTYIPKETRSIALADASVTSSFLDLFGRPARDTGLESERNNAPSAAQRLHLLNSSHVRSKLLESATLRALADSRSPVDELYLMVLSRNPTDKEREIIAVHEPAGANGAGLIADLAWVLLNTAEFQYRH
jgi:hypothetical protein